jgi:acyl-ACP thioesterase
MLLFYVQEVAGIHATTLGAGYDALLAKNLFWAILRTKVQITRLPRSGETIRLETWPMPTSRVAYPRSVVAYDAQGQEVFRSISLWCLMDAQNRSMVLPGKSGVMVEGTLRGNELAVPGSLAIKTLEHTASRTVLFSDLDRNGHMNNTRYMEWCNDLLPSAFHSAHIPEEFTICYHAESMEGQALDIQYQMGDNGLFHVDAWRKNELNAGTSQRVFTAQIQYGHDIL